MNKLNQTFPVSIHIHNLPVTPATPQKVSSCRPPVFLHKQADHQATHYTENKLQLLLFHKVYVIIKPITYSLEI